MREPAATRLRGRSFDRSQVVKGAHGGNSPHPADHRCRRLVMLPITNPSFTSLTTGAWPDRGGNRAYVWDRTTGTYQGQRRANRVTSIAEAVVASGGTVGSAQHFILQGTAPTTSTTSTSTMSTSTLRDPATPSLPTSSTSIVGSTTTVARPGDRSEPDAAPGRCGPGGGRRNRGTAESATPADDARMTDTWLPPLP